ncbi:MAG: hypothetical protein JXA87_01280 [Thermoleophilia bacterium]|nr:hypothetical protein [Thermoleophilia bacterium]
MVVEVGSCRFGGPLAHIQASGRFREGPEEGGELKRCLPLLLAMLLLMLMLLAVGCPLGSP